LPYRFDFFVSYRRSYLRNGKPQETAVGAWVKQVFYPELCALWNEQQPDAQVFLDEESIPTGAHWPSYLKEAIRDSRCLLPIWSPPYFGSRWCKAELESMRLREKQCNIHLAQGRGLVVPVVFHDGDSFPAEARFTQNLSFHTLSHLRAGDGLVELRKRLRDDLLPSLVAAHQKAPDWRADFQLASIGDDDSDPPMPFRGMTGGTP
jgi:hypothetical protein